MPSLVIENALEIRGGGTITLSKLTGNTYDHPTNLFCCGCPLPVTMMAASDTTNAGWRRKALYVLQLVFTMLFDRIPRQVYMITLLYLPALYSTRVSRILKGAEITQIKVRKLYMTALLNVVEELAAEAEAEEQEKTEMGKRSN